MESTRMAPLDMPAFCDGANTLYVCSTGRYQRHSRPSWSRWSAMSVTPPTNETDVSPAARRSSWRSTRWPTSHRSPTFRPSSARGRGRGCSCWPACRTSRRPERVWGGAADGFLSLFGTTVVLRGIADTRTLRDLSSLAGDHRVRSTTVSRSVDHWGRIRPSTSVGTTPQARLPVDALALRGPRKGTRARSAQRRARGRAHPGPRMRSVAAARATGADGGTGRSRSGALTRPAQVDVSPPERPGSPDQTALDLGCRTGSAALQPGPRYLHAACRAQMVGQSCGRHQRR